MLGEDCQVWAAQVVLGMTAYEVGIGQNLPAGFKEQRSTGEVCLISGGLNIMLLLLVCLFHLLHRSSPFSTGLLTLNALLRSCLGHVGDGGFHEEA